MSGGEERMPTRGPGDPRELLQIWMEWEEGETTPGKVLSDLKKAGMRELLDALAEQAEDAPASEDAATPPPGDG